MPDDSRHENDVMTRDVAANSKIVDAWTAHRTETGAVYYYNALTGVSTYEKPAGFKGEVLITKLLALNYAFSQIFSGALCINNCLV